MTFSKIKVQLEKQKNTIFVMCFCFSKIQKKSLINEMYILTTAKGIPAFGL